MSMLHFRLFAARVSLLILAACAISDSDVTAAELRKLNPLGTTAKAFGAAVAIEGQYVVVGADADTAHGHLAGAAYVFNASTGAQLRILYPNEEHTTDLFGSSVAISNGKVLVGAYEDDPNPGARYTGSAYLFDLATGTQLAKFSGGTGSADFGFSAALDGNTALIGARLDRGNGADAGAAFLFDTVTKAQLFRLSPSDAAPYDSFGTSVALAGGRALVGSLYDDDHGTSSGSAYLFDTATGTQLHKLTAGDAAASDWFGNTVALNGSLALVGAPGDDDNGDTSGSAYLFDVNSGAQLRKLKPTDGSALSAFGNSVAVAGNIAVIGATLTNAQGTESGAAYLFDLTTGAQFAKLLPSDGAAGDWFGARVNIESNRAVIAALRDDTALGVNAGSAYIFDVTAPLAGDYSGNGSVGPEDYDAWKLHFGSTSNLSADGNGNGVIDAGDYSIWRDRFGIGAGSGSSSITAVPEPQTSPLAVCAVAAMLIYGRREF